MSSVYIQKKLPDRVHPAGKNSASTVEMSGILSKYNQRGWNWFSCDLGWDATAVIYDKVEKKKVVGYGKKKVAFPGGSWIGGSYDDGGGNIDAAPKFINQVDPSSAPTTNGNLRLKSDSPAIDKGDNTFITGVPTDLAGEPRIVDGDKNGTLIVDMGAYEYIEYTHEGYLPLIIQ